ncbi:MAG: polysaccharide biosynthesis protein [Rhodanobacter sp. 68-29]|nr:oligosaccharide flippase family protein [Rhodanobacter sp.]ODU73122.1 MAG: polysaccharide biosynthesis protein [Rhodanobacter sp. SCN 69-32]OJY58049.1 MAG: polysaccharide biosynthesis protein [Rhodanobacter sp. 68-29]
MNSRSLALRNTLFSSVGLYVEYFLGMVCAVLIARHLGPHQYGIYGMFIWFAAIGIVVTNSGITTGVIKFVAELRGSRQAELIRPMLGHMRMVQRWHLVVVLGLGLALFLLFGHRYAAELGTLEFVLLAAAVGMRAPYMFNVSIAKGFEAFDATARITLIAAPTNLALVVAAMLLHGDILWFVVMYSASSVIFLLASQYQVRRLLAPLPRGGSLPAELLQRIRRHLRIVSLTIIVSFVIASDVEILFLNMFASADSAGYFKVAYQLASGIMLLVPGVFSAVLLPMMAKALSEGRSEGGRRFVAATSYLALLGAPMVAFGACFASAVIGLLYGNAYAAAAPVFALCMLASALNTSAQGATSLLVSADRQHVILTLTLLFGVFKMAMDVTLIRAYGLHGAMTAIVVAAVVSSGAYLLLGMRVGGQPLDWRRLGRILLAAALAGGVAALVLPLRLPPLATLLLGGPLLLGAYALLTLWLRCWTLADIEQLKDLHRRFAAGRPLVLGRLLDWSGTRAEQRP